MRATQPVSAGSHRQPAAHAATGVRRWLTAPLLILGLVLLEGASARAQKGTTFPTPRLATVMPPGGRAGTRVEVTLGGADLEESASLYCSHPGLKAERLADPPSPDPKKPAPTAPPRFAITVAADVPPGIYDVRAVGKWGVSNPRAFAVGDLVEVLEQEPNSDVPQAQRVPLNSTISGAIGANVDVDYFAFPGRKGQRVLVRCAAGSIDSRLTPLVQLFDAAGRQLATNHDYRNRDAVLDCVLPEDGDYHVRLSQYAYQGGGAEYFYRLTISTTPWIDAVYPPVVEPGKPSTVTLFGRNLPGGKAEGQGLEQVTVTIQAPAPRPGSGLDFHGTALPRCGSLDGFGYRTRNDAGNSNVVLLTYAAAPVVLDNEDNDTPEKAQEIPVPCELCGRIEKKRDRDWYVFTGKKGDVLVLEGFADRLGSPIDLSFLVRQADSKQVVGEFDDHTDIPTTMERFYTRTEDPRGRIVLPADGRYELLVRSMTADVRAGPRQVYRVSVRRERPDFHLIVVGNTDTSGGGCTVRRGGSQDLQVVCFRQDGFEGEVALSVEGLPAGVSCPLQVLGPNQKQTALVVTAAPDAAPWAGEIKVTGRATIDGKEIVREGRAGCIVWPTQQPNQPAVSRLSRSLVLAVRDQGPFRLDVPLKEASVPLGGTLELKVQVERQFSDFKAPVQLTRVSAPGLSNGQPINIPNTTVSPTQKEATIKIAVPTNAVPGTYNLVFRGTGQFAFDRGDKKKQNIAVTQVTPPVRLTVFKGVADLSVANAAVTVPPGGSVPLDVKIKRLAGYKGELKLELVLPNGFGGVSAVPVTVPAGANEARLVLKAASTAKPGSNGNVLVRATAVVDKATLTHDARITLTIGKDKDAGSTSAEQQTLTLLADGSAGWKYIAAAKVKGDRWRQLDFDDKGWKSGKAPLGYGEDEIAARKGTLIEEKGQPVLFRKVIDVPAELLAKKGVTVQLAVASDDSAVVYVNGEVADSEDADHEFMYWNREVEVPAKLLRPGKNVVAVLVHNKEGSSDLYLDLKLTGRAPAAKVSPKK
jgi:hypothetical protein